MNRQARQHVLTTAAAALVGGLASVALAAEAPLPDTGLPRQQGTHFFEIYHCGELAGVVWVTPGEAVTFRTSSLESAGVRRAALDARADAVEQGTAFAVHGDKGGCADA